MSTGGNTTGEVLPELSILGATAQPLAVLVADVTPLRGAVRKQEVTVWIVFIIFSAPHTQVTPQLYAFILTLFVFPPPLM